MLSHLLFFFTLPFLYRAATPDPQTLWKGPALDAKDPLYAGLKQIEGVKHMLVHNGSQVGRTYSHHAIVENVNGRLWAAWSSATNDEDSMGQQVWVGTADRNGSSWKWNKPAIPGPSALLPNQTSVGEQNYTYWCNQGIIQRALQPSALVEYNGDIYSIIEPVDRVCPGGPGSNSGAVDGAGRLAARFNISTGQLTAKACWLSKNSFTTASQYKQTPLGDSLCSTDILNGLNPLLDRPDILPFTDARMINSPKFVGSDGSSSMTEVTHAVWNEQGQYWARFWRDSTGSKTTFVHWVEFSSEETGNDWFPAKFNSNGANPGMVPTNIPDSNTKSFYGRLPDGRTYLVTNLMYHPDTKERQPLCITLASDGVHFDWAGVLRTNASRVIIPDSRKIKRVGFSYPHATVVDDMLYVGYSEDKENIWVTEVPIASLGN
ncbi:hypothetical protein E1B28_012065 [Marasmius oreades]|uniref:Sialidase domain-containing protein n=1 Tax=Marasmius oreades TaxID=181124 RepID=A0A9P7RRF2_9AGAR|nr:uncharacterized protein E1B28_012065 [Marasmius oreades]KAG7088028.1 hypothetical protein E1B28_012065 [Marasmius oreades]